MKQSTCFDSIKRVLRGLPAEQLGMPKFDIEAADVPDVAASAHQRSRLMLSFLFNTAADPILAKDVRFHR